MPIDTIHRKIVVCKNFGSIPLIAYNAGKWLATEHPDRLTYEGIDAHYLAVSPDGVHTLVALYSAKEDWLQFFISDLGLMELSDSVAADAHTAGWKKHGDFAKVGDVHMQMVEREGPDANGDYWLQPHCCKGCNTNPHGTVKLQKVKENMTLQIDATTAAGQREIAEKKAKGHKVKTD